MPVLGLAIYYFFSNSINRESKYVAAGILGIFFLSFVVQPLYLIWHGFDVPDWFEGRFSFIFCFFIVYIAFLSIAQEDKRKKRMSSSPKIKFIFPKIKLKNIVGLVIVLCGILYFADINDKNNVIIAVTIMFCCLYGIILYAYQNEKQQKYISQAILVVLCFELLINAGVCSTLFQQEEDYFNYFEYQNYYKINKDIVNSIKAIDDSEYRTEKNYRRRENEGLSLDYQGISMFSSSYNPFFHDFLQKTGVVAGGKLAWYEGSTLVMDSLLNIKYLLLKNDTHPVYQKIFNSDNVTVYQNPYTFGYGTLISSPERNVDIFSYSNPFELQNELVKNLSGDNKKVFEVISGKLQLINLEITDDEGYRKIDNEKEAYFEYKIPNMHEDILYAYLPIESGEIEKVLINGVQASGKRGYNYKIYDLNSKLDSEINNFQVYLKTDTLVLKDNEIFFKLNQETFNGVMDKVKEQKVDIVFEKQSRLSAQCNADEKYKYLFTSIPYDENWKANVNGKQVNTEKLFNGLIGVPLELGTNEIILTYQPKGLRLGVTFSVVAMVIIFVLFIKKRKC